MAGPATANAPIPENGTDQPFDTALRGYDRRQVDEFVGSRAKEFGRLKAQLADERRQRQAATERADALAAELRELRARSPHEPAVPEESFGFRAEKLLRMAEQEAVEIRGNASRESASIIEQARKEAEQHRHEVEQTLISRASLLEQQAAQRSAELQEREQQVADQLAAAREQAEQMHAAASRAADRLRQESEAAAEETRVRAETAAQRQRDQAAQEVGRLSALQADVRSELGRLAEVLTAELAADGRASVRPVPRSPQGPDSAAGAARNGADRKASAEPPAARVGNGRAR